VTGLIDSGADLTEDAQVRWPLLSDGIGSNRWQLLFASQEYPTLVPSSP
jgi:hypothetical protein